MEAEDTVMNSGQMNQAVLANLELPMGQAIATKQAEISFKAGYDEGRLYGQAEGRLGKSVEDYERGIKAGIEEGVEWIEEHSSLLSVGDIPDKVTIWEDAWQAQKESWGIEQKEIKP